MIILLIFVLFVLIGSLFYIISEIVYDIKIRKDNKRIKQEKANNLKAKKLAELEKCQELVDSKKFNQALENAKSYYKIIANIEKLYQEDVVYFTISPYKPQECLQEANSYYTEKGIFQYVYFEVLFTGRKVLSGKETAEYFKSIGNYKLMRNTIYTSYYRGLFSDCEEMKSIDYEYVLRSLHNTRNNLDAVLAFPCYTINGSLDDQKLFLKHLKDKCKDVKSSAKWYF